MSEDPCTPKEEKQERLSRHKETVQRSQAEEEAHLLAQQRLVYDRSCRALKRRTAVRKHELEQEQLREVTPFTPTTSQETTQQQQMMYPNHSLECCCGFGHKIWLKKKKKNVQCKSQQS